MTETMRDFVDAELRAVRLERKLVALGFKVRPGAFAPVMSPELRRNPSGEHRPLLMRSLGSVEPGRDGRSLEILCAPFDTPTTVLDKPPHGDGKPYVESFRLGCFREATADPLSVLLDLRHDIRRILGHAVELVEKPDALYGRFLVHGSRKIARATMDAVRDGLSGASVGFVPVENRRTAAGVLERVRVDLLGVALCPQGAYSEARVVAARSAV